MTLDELIKKFNGIFVEIAGSANAKNQCTDLANLYIRDVLNLPIIEWTNAKDFPKKAGSKYEFIKNTPEGVPQKGDIVVWNGNVGGGAGHIAVFVEGNVNKFTSFDQNYPVGSPCHLQGHYYKNISGWLRVKENADYYEGLDLNNKESMKIAVDIWAKLRDGKLVEASEYVKMQKENINLKPKAEKWESVCKIYNIKSVEELTKIIDGIPEKDTKCEKKMEELKKQHELQINLLKKQIIKLDDLSFHEIFGIFLKKLKKLLAEH